jgi:hypothetical protein
MNGSTLIREKPVKPYSPSAGSPPAAAHTAEGVGFAAATAGFPAPILTRAETAPCTCPEHCERDHEND